MSSQGVERSVESAIVLESLVSRAKVLHGEVSALNLPDGQIKANTAHEAASRTVMEFFENFGMNPQVLVYHLTCSTNTTPSRAPVKSPGFFAPDGLPSSSWGQEIDAALKEIAVRIVSAELLSRNPAMHSEDQSRKEYASNYRPPRRR